jgi:Lrp/AsnC family transcriptional regulator for asnA, asnC and gidA
MLLGSCWCILIIMNPKNLKIYKVKPSSLLTLISLDDNDLKLVKILSQNGRMSGLEISKRLKVSPSTVARKIQRLEENGVIKGYVAIIDNVQMGNLARSAMTIKLTGGADINQVLDKLVQIYDICNIFETMGNYDILLTCCNKDEAQIYELIKEIRAWDGVLFVDFTTIVSMRKILKKPL